MNAHRSHITDLLSHPDVATARTVLDEFGVPYLIVDADARRLHLSPHAEAIGARLADAEVVWSQIARCAAYTLSQSPVPRYFDGTPCSLSLPGITFRGQTIRTSMGRVAVIALRAAPATDAPPASALDPLTPREAEVARLIASALSLKQVAATLAISVHTARRHCEKIYHKLGIQSRAQLVLLLSERAPALKRSA